MRTLRFVIATLCMAATAAMASPADPTEGKEITTMAKPVPVAANLGKKVEVIEFFMYHCPHCFVLNPALEAWVKKQGDNVAFKRVHFAYTGPNDPEAHTFLTLEAMGLADTKSQSVFESLHNLRNYWKKDEQAFDWASKSGVDMAKFKAVWSSFGVMTKLKGLDKIVERYKVDGAPTIIVDGRIITSPSQVMAGSPGMTEGASSQALTQVLDVLVARVQKDKGIKPAK